MTHPPTILVISSQGIVRFFTTELRTKGYCVYGITNALESKAVYERVRPDLLLVFDHFIEGITEGSVLCRQLRLFVGNVVPILLLSSYLPPDMAEHHIICFDIVGGIATSIAYIQHILPVQAP